MIFVSSKESSTKEALSKDYIKCYTIVEDGKSIDILYNPNERDSSKAYMKKGDN